jgi:hypothetical protein
MSPGYHFNAPARSFFRNRAGVKFVTLLSCGFLEGWILLLQQVADSVWVTR